MTKDEKEQSFEDWWHGDDGDEPITDVAKDRAKEIFMAGFHFGSRKPIYMMSQAQYQVIVKLIEEKIRKEYDKRV